MKFKDLRDFVQQLEQRGELKRIQMPISPVLEMTEICDRTLRNKGPALLFENPTGYDIPVLGNLFGTPDRVAFGMGAESVSELREIGKLLAFLKEPEPPKGLEGRLVEAADLPQDHCHGAQSGQGRGVPGSGHRGR